MESIHCRCSDLEVYLLQQMCCFRAQLPEKPAVVVWFRQKKKKKRDGIGIGLAHTAKKSQKMSSEDFHCLTEACKKSLYYKRKALQNSIGSKTRETISNLLSLL